MSITGVANALTDLKAMEAANRIQYAVVAQVNEVARQQGEAVVALLEQAARDDPSSPRQR